VKEKFSFCISLSQSPGFRKLKVLLSVGGWTYSQDGHFSFVTNPTLRATFVTSAIRLIKDYGLDGMYVVRSCAQICLRFDFATIVATSTLNIQVAPNKVADLQIFSQKCARRWTRSQGATETLSLISLP
jgi:hypothetical protein